MTFPAHKSYIQADIGDVVNTHTYTDIPPPIRWQKAVISVVGIE